MKFVDDDDDDDDDERALYSERPYIYVLRKGHTGKGPTEMNLLGE